MRRPAHFVLVLIGSLLGSARLDVASAEEFGIVFGGSIRARCDARFCHTEGSADFFPGSLIARSKPRLSAEQCSARIQNQAGHVGYNSTIAIDRGSLSALKEDQLPGVDELRKVQRSLGGNVHVEYDLQYREDIDESHFLTLVQSVPAACRSEVKMNPSRWDVVKSRFFGRITIKISIPPTVSVIGALEVLRPFALKTGQYYVVSGKQPDQVTFTSKDFILYAVTTETVTEFSRRYPNALD